MDVEKKQIIYGKSTRKPGCELQLMLFSVHRDGLQHCD